MVRLRNVLFLGLFLISMVLVGCRGNKSVELSAAFPQDIDIAFVADYSDEDQVDNLKDILAKFPELSQLFQALNYPLGVFLENAGVSYEEEIKPIFRGGWKFGLAFNNPDEGSTEGGSTTNLRGTIDSMEFYMALELEEADKFQDLIEKLIGDEADYKEDGKAEYWSNGGGGAVLRYEDIFVLSMNLEDAEGAANRLENGGGLNESEAFKKAAGDAGNLGFFYINLGKFGELITQSYEEIGFSQIAEIIEVFENVYFAVSAEKDGMMFSTSMSFDADAAGFDKIFPNPEYKLSLVDKANGEGLIFYNEQPSFESIFRSFVELYQLGTSEIYQEIVAEETYEEIVADFSKEFGLDEDKFGNLIDSPFALSVSRPDQEKVIPVISLYFKLAKEEIETAKKLLAILDDDIDELLVEFDELALENGGKVGIIKKDLEIVSGGGIRKLSIDWKAFSKEDLETLGVVGLDLGQVDSNLYYGLTGDDVLVLVLSPNFPELYGKNVVSDDKSFKQAMDKLKIENLGYVDYLNVGEAMSLYEKVVEVTGFDDKAASGLVFGYEDIKPILSHFEYLVGGSELGKDFVKGNAFIGVK